MKKVVFIASTLAIIFASTKTVAQEKKEKLDEVVVTATKVKTNKKNIGKIVYKITKKEIENNQGKSIVDLLNAVPGVEINGNYNTKGQNLGYYIRGGRNRQVAILIDGVNVSDPSSFNGDFDLRQIDLDQVESIEVLKGAASTLYGTAAATGVINILLKKASKKEFAGSFSTSIGSNRSAENLKFAPDELSGNFNFNGTINKVDYLLGLGIFGSSGLSAAESTTKNVIFSEDKFYRNNAFLQLGFHVKTKLKLGVFGSFNEFSADYDGSKYDFNTGKSTTVDADNELTNNQKRTGVTADYVYEKGELKVRTFYTEIKRNTFPSNDLYKGKVYGFDMFNNYKINEEYSVLLGVASQYQDMLQKTQYSTIEEGSGKQHFYDPYVSVNYNSKLGLNINAGARLNIHSEYGSNFVFNVNPSYNIQISEENILKVFASYSTAFVTPTLSEIFNKLATVSELLPEKDVNIEGGFELDIAKKITLNGTYFYREETDKIGYDNATFKVINDLGTFNARGIEAALVYSPISTLNLAATYGYVTRDENLLLKIPQHKLGIKANYNITPSTFTSIGYQFVDKTKDFGDIDLEAYNLVDFFINQKIIDNRVTLFANVTNLLNENYQELAGYSTRGRNFKLGVRIQF